MLSTDKYHEAVEKLDKLTADNEKKINSKAGLTKTDLVYQMIAKPSMGNNFWKAMVFWSIVAFLIPLVFIFLTLIFN